MLVGIEHGLTFPLSYFDAHGLLPDWPGFLDDFQFHWPTQGDDSYVDRMRHGSVGHRAARLAHHNQRSADIEAEVHGASARQGSGEPR